MTSGKWEAARLKRSNQKCLFCDLSLERTIILQTADDTIRGWRCSKCGFKVMHPEDIPKVLKLLKQEIKIRRY